MSIMMEQVNAGQAVYTKRTLAVYDFGATLLQGGVRRSWVAKRLMAIYNKKGIFTNERDDLHGLKQALDARFRDVSVEVAGCAAIFSARA
jgi:hypothetical protein